MRCEFKKTLVLFMGVCFISLIYSCKNNEIRRISKEIKPWLGKQVYLPKLSNKRTLERNPLSPLEKKVKIMTIIDASCGTCIEEFDKWKDFMKSTDTTLVGYVFLLYSNDDLMTFESTNANYLQFTYPYFNDKKNEVITKNGFNLEQKNNNTFLLNKKNEIILVGNPIYSNSVSKLYLKEISKISNAD